MSTTALATRIALQTSPRQRLEDEQIGIASSTGTEEAATTGLVITPNQGPVASFFTTPGSAGSATAFDGSSSSDRDGTVARFDWNFGDGSTASNGGPRPTHIYANPGTYNVTLKVTDDEGCSTAQTYTGQTVSCNGTAAATVLHQVTIAKAKPSPPNTKITKAKIKKKKGKATFRFKAIGTATGFECR